MIEHLSLYISDFLSKPTYVLLTFLSLTLAIISFIQARQNTFSIGTRLFLLYAHLAFIIAPFALLSYSVGCSVPAYDCSAKSLIYSIPLLLAGIIAVASVIGFVAGPRLYARALGAESWSATKAIKETLKRHGTSHVRLHTLNTAKPLAFSYGNRIFLSIGMIDLLTPKELEAVVLHELGHVTHRSSWLKAGRLVTRFVSPLAHFSNWNETLSAEERYADAYAISAQKTTKHVESARKKVELF
jgi:Zn-dependent protease with chaperone function